MKRVEIQRTGGPEVLQWVDGPVPEPGLGQVLVRHKAVGLNFIDVYQRKGVYPMELPATLGHEFAGVVEAVGDGVQGFSGGDRVASAAAKGAYAQESVQKADLLVHLPDDVDFETAAASMLKGMTAAMLALSLRAVQAGETVLVHAAAGGVGGLLTQWLTHIGVKVIGTAGSPEKAWIARGHGCTDVIEYRHEDVAERVHALTGGRGVSMVYDAVGADTLEASLASLGKRAMFVSYGNASGVVPPIAPLRLLQGGSLFMTRPSLFDYNDTPQALRNRAAALFNMIASGALKVQIGSRRPLQEAAQAHEELEARRTTGSTILIP